MRGRSDADRDPWNVVPATADRWGDICALFGPRGACAGCWCMWGRLPKREYDSGRGSANKRALRRLVAASPAPGVIAYSDDAPIGWCAIAPREEFRRLATSRLFRPLDDRPAWAIMCLFVDKTFRGRGVAVALIEEAVRYAASCGATLVEAYPHDLEPGTVRPPTFVWQGLASSFRRAGFVEIARPSSTRPIMRRQCGR